MTINFPERQPKFCGQCPEVERCVSPIEGVIPVDTTPATAIKYRQPLPVRMASAVVSAVVAKVSPTNDKETQVLFPFDQNGLLGPAYEAEVADSYDLDAHLEELQADLVDCTGPTDAGCPVMQDRDTAVGMPAGIAERAKWIARTTQAARQEESSATE